MKLYKSILAVALLFVGLNIGNAHAQSCSALMNSMTNPLESITFQAMGNSDNAHGAEYITGTLMYYPTTSLCTGSGLFKHCTNPIWAHISGIADEFILSYTTILNAAGDPIPNLPTGLEGFNSPVSVTHKSVNINFEVASGLLTVVDASGTSRTVMPTCPQANNTSGPDPIVSPGHTYLVANLPSFYSADGWDEVFVFAFQLQATIFRH